MQPDHLPQTEYKQPPHQLQTTKFKISETGNIEFEGDVTDKQTQETLIQLLNQADYYRQNAQKLEREKLSKSNYDPVIIAFASVFMFVIMTMTYSAVSAIGQSFQKPANLQPTEINWR